MSELDLLDGGALRDDAAAFLGTVRPDGRPHSARVGAAWYDGDIYFQTGHQTRKARNLEGNPACTVSMSLTGIDLVFEGAAERVTDGPTLEAVAAVWQDGGNSRLSRQKAGRCRFPSERQSRVPLFVQSTSGTIWPQRTNVREGGS